jgi:hypothetical protein
MGFGRPRHFMTAFVTKEMEEEGCIPASYCIRIFDGIHKFPSKDEADKSIVAYDSNTINLRAATEFIGMVIRKHAVEAEDVHFEPDCYDLELSWRSYAELR